MCYHRRYAPDFLGGHSMKKQLCFVFPLVFLLALTIQAYEGQWKTYTVADSLASPDVTVIFQDIRGDLWFGTSSGGVSQFDGEKFRSFTEKDGLPGNRVRKIFEDNQGHLWFITDSSKERGLVSRYDGKTFRRITEQDGLAGGFSNVMLKDKAGNLWFANGYGLTKYNRKRFQSFSDEKFVRDRITAIFEDSKGNIWLSGNYIGNARNLYDDYYLGSPFLIRYDGTEFEYFDLDFLPETREPKMIQAIAEDNAGNLWFGGRLVLFKYDGKRFERFDQRKPYTEERHVSPGSVFIHYREPKKVSVSAHFSFSDWSSRDSRLTFNVLRRSAEISIDSIFKDSHGGLWFNNQGFISRWDGKELRHFVTPKNWREIRDYIWLDKSEPPSFYPGHVLLEDTQGKLWFKGFEGAYAYNGVDFYMFTGDEGLGDNISAIFEDREGNIWFGHGSGVTRFGLPGIQNLTTKEALDSNRIGTIFEDGRGFVWFTVLGRGIRPGGIARYDGKKLQCFSIIKQMGSPWRPPGDISYILDDGKDGVYFVCPAAAQGWFRYSRGRFRHYGFPCSASEYGGFEPVFDSEGKLWIGMATVSGDPIRHDGKKAERLTKLGAKRRGEAAFQGWKAVRDKAEAIGMDVVAGRMGAMHEDRRGNLWFVTRGEGLRRYDGTTLETVATSIHDFPCRFFEDKQGNLWFAAYTFLSKYDGQSFQRFPVQRTSFADLAAIHQDVHGVIWFIYSRPLRRPDKLGLLIGRYDGTNFELLRPEELAQSVLHASTVDRAGNLWLATANGAIKYDGKEFTTYTTEDGFLANNLRDVREDSRGNLWFATWGGGVVRYDGAIFQSLTTRGGLIHDNVHTIFEDSRGHLWFATEGGITKYMPKGMDILPQIKLTKLIADDVYTDFEEALHLPYRARRLAFEYQGHSLQRAKLLYTHKLVGHDTDWSQPSIGNRVMYDGLKPGRYVFWVKAIREDLEYANPPAVVTFTIAPPFWTQWQFYTPFGIGVVMLFLIARLVVQWRRAVALRAELRQKEEAEIQRVFQELKDAREMQMGLLPQAVPHVDGFELAGASLPATEVGGDFYDYLTLGDNQVGIALADVSGKGLRGAMNAVLTNGMLHEVVQLESKARAILS